MVLLDSAWCQKHDTLLADQNGCVFAKLLYAFAPILLLSMASLVSFCMNGHASKSSMHAVVVSPTMLSNSTLDYLR